MTLPSNIQECLNQEIWAVVGVSTNPAKFGHKVYKKLKRCGYTVYPVNPKLSEIDGDPCYPTLSALPFLPDVVSIIVPPSVTEQIIEDCAQLGIKRVWMQPGAECQEALRKGREKGLKLVANECVLVQAQPR